MFADLTSSIVDFLFDYYISFYSILTKIEFFSSAPTHSGAEEK